MSLLTEQEIAQTLGCVSMDSWDEITMQIRECIADARAIESAVIAKIKAQGPAWYHKHWGEEDDIFYSPDQNIPDGSVPLYKLPEGD